MKTVCCICQQTMKEGPTKDDKVSHGICDACMPQYLIDNGTDSEGFRPFYDDIEANKKIVDRKLWLDEVIHKGFYYK